MASFPPFKKSLFRIITVITIICLLVISCTIPASAFSDDEFPNKTDFPSVNIPCSRPVFSDNLRYAEVLTKNGSEFQVYLFIFECIVKSHDALFSISPRCVDGNIMTFTSYVSSNQDDFASLRYECYSYDSISGSFELREKSLIDDVTNAHGETLTFIFPYGIYGVHYYGFDLSSYSVPELQYEFVVNYASEGLILNHLKNISTNLTNFYNYSMSWFSAINSNIVNIFRCFETSLVYLTRLSENFEGFMDNFFIFFETLLDQNNALLEGPYISEGDSSLPPSQVAPPRDDSTIDDIKEAEKDAVGGKTDEEIQQGVEDALDQDKQKEQINAEDIPTSDIEISHNVFNVVFDFMGPAWNSYFILTLTVAFAAFLIGRRY